MVTANIRGKNNLGLYFCCICTSSTLELSRATASETDRRLLPAKTSTHFECDDESHFIIRQCLLEATLLHQLHELYKTLKRRWCSSVWAKMAGLRASSGQYVVTDSDTWWMANVVSHFTMSNWCRNWSRIQCSHPREVYPCAASMYAITWSVIKRNSTRMARIELNAVPMGALAIDALALSALPMENTAQLTLLDPPRPSSSSTRRRRSPILSHSTF